MVRERIVVGATGDDSAARREARRLRDAGHEVVFVGGGQSAEQLVRAAVAEDATRLVVDADGAARQRIAALGGELGIGEDLTVTAVLNGDQGVSAM